MRFLTASRTAWLLSTLLASLIGTQALAEPPASKPDVDAKQPAAAASTPDPDALLEQALDLERSRNWPGAIEVYERALSRWPSRTEFSHRRRLCESHYRLTRRYQDPSFRNVLLRLPREKALELYDELIDRVQTHYVDAVAFDPLVRRGLDNIEIALRDPTFLKTNSTQPRPDRVTWLRETLRADRGRLTIPDRAAAEGQVLRACDFGHQAIGLNPAAVILEFAYGACDALDDYTSYLTPDKLDDLYAMIDGNFVGLGIELKLDKQGLRLVGVIRGGPAWEAGVKTNDIVTRVNGQTMLGLSLDEAAARLQGTEGTPVEIVVLRSGGVSKSYRLVRRHVEVDSVAQARIIDPTSGVGYIQLTGFQKSSAEELEKAIAALRRQGMKSLVLDLRGNPGGLLNVSVEIAERFIDNGIIVSTRGRAPGQSQVYRANSKAVWRMPLVVTIDHDSASASEILAGALKDHDRAIIVGERSYGKGSVQSIFALRSAPAGLKLTTAKFYSPRNRPYSEQGVEPDVAVTAHIVAKPNGESSARANTEVVIGDPARDPVLEQGIRQARRQLNAAR